MKFNSWQRNKKTILKDVLDTLRAGVRFLLRRMVALSILSATLVFLTLSLATFHAQDPSWFYYTSSSTVIHNLCGRLGATAAALLVYLFGAAAWGIVALGAYVAYLLLFKRAFKPEFDRLVACVGMVFLAATLQYLTGADPLGVAPGGFSGAFVGNTMLGFFDVMAAQVVVLGLMFIGTVLVLRFSFIGIAPYTLAVLNFFCSKERCLLPAYRVSRNIALMCYWPIAWCGSFCHRLLSGALLEEAEEPVFELDYQLLLDEQEKTIHRDKVWENYRQEMPLHMLTPQQTHEEEYIVSPETYAWDEPSDSIKEKVDAAAKMVTNKTIINKRPLPRPAIRYTLPNMGIFTAVDGGAVDDGHSKELEQQAHILEEKLETFGVAGTVTSIKFGPVITLFEYQPDIDSKISKIMALEDDLALALQATSIRIIAPIPGRSVVGFEVANKERRDVLFATAATSSAFKEFSGNLPLILGEDTVGNKVVIDLARMPHLLIAGSTGSGKSVSLNAMLMSFLCKQGPDELKLILIDPKRLEFAPYADIAHLLFPIVTDPRRAAPVLKWVIKEMEQRYERMAAVGARNILDYRKIMAQSGLPEKTPFIVVVIDELADLMMTAGKEIEEHIARIAQMARAAGIHLIVATQRPSVDVITGLIKVNFPSRISFRVTSKIDSRTILDCAGADKLLGRGDMLFLDSHESVLKRVHGAYVSDHEISRVVSHIREQRAVQYLDLEELVPPADDMLHEADDKLYQDVLAFIQQVDEVSISLFQRKFRIGYNRSARIMEKLEAQGLIMPADGGKLRKVVR